MNNLVSKSSRPTVTRRSHTERTDLSDQRMLEAAIQLIVQHGTQKTTLKAVGEQAGYSRGLAGYRFGSKAGLFTFVMKSVGEEWLQELTQVTQAKSGLDAICAATDAHMHFCLEAPDHVRAFYTLWYESIGAERELKSMIASIHERRRHDVETWIKHGMQEGSVPPECDSAGAANHFSAAIIGIAYQWLANPDDRETVISLHQNLKITMTHWLKPDR